MNQNYNKCRLLFIFSTMYVIVLHGTKKEKETPTSRFPCRRGVGGRVPDLAGLAAVYGMRAAGFECVPSSSPRAR